MWGVTTRHIKQYREYQLYTLNDSDKSTKNREYLLEFKVNFKTSSDTVQGAWEEPIPKKIRGK